MTKSPEGLPIGRLQELTSWSRGMRAVSAFGSLYGKQVSEEVEQEPIEEGGTYVATVRRFNGRTMKYEVEKTVLVELLQGASVGDIFSRVLCGKRETFPLKKFNLTSFLQ